jgi:hypothetical protein
VVVADFVAWAAGRRAAAITAGRSRTRSAASDANRS